MSSEIALKVDGLSKRYEIYDSPTDRLKQFIVPRIASLLGKIPNSYFREFWALHNVSFEIRRGESVGIIGRNGGGKSTLLQMICGTLNPTSGNLQAFGKIAALLELGSGFNPDFTGRENVYLNAALLGLSRDQIDSRFSKIAAFADIGEFIEQPVRTYSSGMMVRLAFSVIAHVDPDILVVDEALAVGDAFFVQKCMRFIRQFQKKGGTLLFVSHDTGAIINLCSRAVLLKNGELIKEGDPKEVTKHYLASLYESEQAIDGVSGALHDATKDPSSGVVEEYRDMRDDIIKASNLRNDIEIFQFNADSDAFGTGDAQIHSVRLLDEDWTPLSWIVGGEDVVLEIRINAYKTVLRPIVGFEFKDRLGQTIFADNTHIVYQQNPQSVDNGGLLIARFAFRFPVLPTGDYSITAAIADGSQDSHVQLHWKHDALLVKVHASSVCYGLVGIPMKKIDLVVA